MFQTLTSLLSILHTKPSLNLIMLFYNVALMKKHNKQEKESNFTKNAYVAGKIPLNTLYFLSHFLVKVGLQPGR